jgi:cysteine-rich protein
MCKENNMADKPEAGDAGEHRFSYGEHFGTMRVLGELLRDPAHRPWLTSVPKVAPHKKHVIWLGCNILRTVQLAETLDDILQYLREDYVTLGGPTACCGAVHVARGDNAVGDNMLQHTMKKFDAFMPEQMICWCPSCDDRLRKQAQDAVTDTAKGRISVTNFLASRLSRMNFSVPVPVAVAIHYHGGFSEQERDGADAKAILARIPRLTVIDMPAMEHLGRHCLDGAIQQYGTDRYSAMLADWDQEARRRGATHTVTIYHSCHRQFHLLWREKLDGGRLPVVNYLTLMARAIGLQERADRFAELASTGSVDAMLQGVANNIERLGIPEEHARRALKSQFQR